MNLGIARPEIQISHAVVENYTGVIVGEPIRPVAFDYWFAVKVRSLCGPRRQMRGLCGLQMWMRFLCGRRAIRFPSKVCVILLVETAAEIFGPQP